MPEPYDYMPDIGPASTDGSLAAAYLGLRSRALGWAQRHGFGAPAEAAASAPDVFYTLAMLLRDGRVPRRSKLKLGIAAAYLALPLDALPFGVLDDVYVALIAITDTLDSVGEDVILEYWPGDADGIKKMKVLLDSLNERYGAGAVRRLAKLLGIRVEIDCA